MKRQYTIPVRDPKRDIGYKWTPGSKMFHYYRSRKKTDLAFSHCGILAQKDQFVEIENLPTCPYCLMIEEMRDSFHKDYNSCPK